MWCTGRWGHRCGAQGGGVIGVVQQTLEFTIIRLNNKTREHVTNLYFNVIDIY